MKSTLYSVLSLSFLVLMNSCGSGSAPTNRGAIVFGDSSTIVTETDPRYLSNNVEDIVAVRHEVIVDTPLASESLKKDSVEVVVPPAARKEELKDLDRKKGLNAPFKGLSVFIANVEAREGKSVNWDKAKGASFTLQQGELNGKTLVIEGAGISKVMQRSQTVVVLKTENGKLLKLSFPSSNSEWQTLRGSNGKYTISGIGKGQLKYNGKFSPNALRNATQKLARNNRMSRKEEQKLLNTIRNVRNPNQPPCSIALQSVVWKISGKDASGKSIERELRIDINL
jgi:hypothetical protein